MDSTNEIDRILSEEEIVRASNDFTARVMRQVRTEAAAPPPIEFPWRRFLPGVLTSVSLVMATFTVLTWLDATSPRPRAGAEGGAPALDAAQSFLSAIASPTGIGLACAAGALLLGGAVTWGATRGGRPVGGGI
jgi:hypothetical protein